MLSRTLAALLLLGGLILPAPTAPAATVPTSVFVVAHQDDELLSMGSGIRQHAEIGRVVVVVATDGAATQARHDIAARLGREVEPWEIVVHRDAEFRWTCRALGADECLAAPDGLRIPDGQATPESADALFSWVAETWPGARVKTHSWLSPHGDHAALGEALHRAYHAGTLEDARFYIAPYELTSFGGREGFPLPTGRTVRPVGDDEQGAYRLWAPDKAPDRYWAVPMSRVERLFDAHRADPVSYHHAPLED